MVLRILRALGLVSVLSLAVMPRADSALRQPWARRPGVVLYHLKDNASESERTTFGKILSARHTASALQAQPAKSFHALAFTASAGDEETLAEELKASGAVDFAEPDYLMPAAAVPN